MSEQIKPSTKVIDSGVNCTAYRKVRNIFALPTLLAEQAIARLSPNENILFTPFVAPLHVVVHMQHGDLKELPFYTAVFSALSTIDPNRAGITESMAADLMTARQMPETRRAVSMVIDEVIPTPTQPVAQLTYTRLHSGRDIDTVANIQPDQMSELVQLIVTNCIKVYPGSETIHDDKATIIRTPKGENIVVKIGYFHKDAHNPFLHIEKGATVIHFKPFSFMGYVNPFDVISWDRAEMHISRKNIRELLSEPPQKQTPEIFEKLTDNGIYFSNANMMQGFTEYEGDDVSVILGPLFLHSMGSPITLTHRKELVEADNLYLTYPQAVARIIRKATEHEANLGTTIKGLYALKQLHSNRYATPAIDPHDLTFLKKKNKLINKQGGLAIHLSLLKPSTEQEVLKTEEAMRADLIAAIIQNPGRMWRYLIGTTFYTLFPRLKDLSIEQIDAINTVLHTHDPQLEELSSFVAGEQHPDYVRHELEYEHLLCILTHPKAEIWNTRNRQKEFIHFEHGIKKLSKAIQQYIQKDSGQSDFDFLTSIFSL